MPMELQYADISSAVSAPASERSLWIHAFPIRTSLKFLSRLMLKDTLLFEMIAKSEHSLSDSVRNYFTCKVLGNV